MSLEEEIDHMKLSNKCMLITYADSLGNNLKDLDEVLDAHFADAIGGVHILPFFPSSADRGFAPMRYDIVDPDFGDWDDVKTIGDKRYLMFDFMINHISRQSPYFQDFLAKKDDSEFADFFIRYKDFWAAEGGFPTDEQVDAIYKRKPRAPYVEAEFADGTTEKVWCTFGEEQIDINVKSERAQRFFDETLRNMADNGASIIRLDAFAYACKRAGGSCFFEQPDTSNLLDAMQDVLGADIMVLPEIHEHYTMQFKVSEMGYWVYDFALPVLTLHALYSGDGQYLKRWMEMSPKHQFTTLDTHDGLGIVDVKDLLPLQHRGLQQPRHLPGQHHLLQRAGQRRRGLRPGPRHPDVCPRHPHGLLRGPARRQERPRAAREHQGRPQHQPPLLQPRGDRLRGRASGGQGAHPHDGAAQQPSRL